MPEKKKTRISLFNGDLWVWAVFFFFVVISVVEVFSASSTLSFRSHNYFAPIANHTLMFFIGIITCIVASAIPCRFFKLIIPWALLVSFGTLIYVLWRGESINGANRVIEIFGFTFQPSELAKGTMVLVTAQILSSTQREDGSGTEKNAMRYILYFLFPIFILIGLENLSTAVLLFGVIFIMMFIGRVPMAQLGKLVAFLAIAGALIFWSGGFYDDDDKASDSTAIMTASSSKQSGVSHSATFTDGQAASAEEVKEEEDGEGLFQKAFHRAHTWRMRLIRFFEHNGEVTPEEYNIDENFQVAHANFAISQSGILGCGPGNSKERDILPQAFSDFIYAIIIEELGLIGAVAIVGLYLLLLVRCYYIARRCENSFPAFLVMGLSILLVAQAVMNMMVAVGIMPVTGQPLPLISKGGSSTIVSCAYIGAIISVSRWAKQREAATV